jgi:tetratricopeptide (TPR) repeat protein
MAATVFVARQLPDDAERELSAGLASRGERAVGEARFGSVALYWLRGLIHFARGDEARALADFERELAAGPSSHLYARECAANTWYAIGAVRLRQGRTAEATGAFQQALAHIPTHPMARAAIGGPPDAAMDAAAPLVAALARAAGLVMAGSHAEAGRLVDAALAEAPPGNAAWFLPVEPILDVSHRPGDWAAALARVRQRAA